MFYLLSAIICRLHQSHQNKAMSGVLKAVNVVINKGKLPYELKEVRPRSCRLIAK